MDSKLLKGAGIVAGATALAAGTACFIVAPRRRDTSVDVRWEVIRRHRYAHRGLHDLTIGVPENSLPAFRRARQYGFGVELDVHLTADDQVVVIHDSDTSRMCGVPGTIEEMRLDQVRELRLAGTGEQIPTLDEVLAVFEPREGEDAPAPLIVEVKSYCDDEELLTLKALAALDAHGVTYCVESFDPRVLSWLRANRPDVVRGQLSENFLRDGRSTLAFPVALGATLLMGNVISRPDFVAYRFEDRNEVGAVRLACGRLGARLVTWTIHTEADLLKSEAEGAPAIFEGFVPDSASTIR